MNWQLLGPLLITTAVGIAGWFVGHALTSRRDRASKRREQRIAFLIEAYRRLEGCARRGTSLDVSKLESAVADIQLFGTPRQVALVQSLLSEFAEKKTVSMDALLQDLRRDLRAELNLPRVPDAVLHLRFGNEQKTD